MSRSRKQMQRAELHFIGQQLQRIADNLEQVKRVNIVAGADAQIALGDIEEVGTNDGEVTQGSDSPLLNHSTFQNVGGSGNNINHSQGIGINVTGNKSIAPNGGAATLIGNTNVGNRTDSGDIVTVDGADSIGKVDWYVQFNEHTNQAIGNVEGDAIHDKTECENNAAGGFAVGNIENVRQERHTDSHNTNSGDAIKDLTAALTTKHRATLPPDNKED